MFWSRFTFCVPVIARRAGRCGESLGRAIMFLPVFARMPFDLSRVR